VTLTGGVFLRRAGTLLDARRRRDDRQSAEAHQGTSVGWAPNGGIMSKYAVGIYSAPPRNGKPGPQCGRQAQVPGGPPSRERARRRAGHRRDLHGSARKDGRADGIISGRARRDGRRFLRTADGRLIALLTDGEQLEIPSVVRRSTTATALARLTRWSRDRGDQALAVRARQR